MHVIPLVLLFRHIACSHNFSVIDNSRKRPEVKIMEQLAAFCMRQACKDTETISVSKQSSSRPTRPSKKSPTTTRYSK